MAERKKQFGDRYDGRLLKSLDSNYKIIPYIMRTRMDSQNFFEEKIDIGRTEAFIREKRKKTHESLSFLHIIIAAMVRTISQKPALNRFIAGQKIYARNEICISFMLKKEMNEESPEAAIKINFAPTDTLWDVVKKVNTAIKQNRSLEYNNTSDNMAKLIMKIPGIFVKLIVWVLRKLDYIGLIPKKLNELSPFHSSIFITDLGSVGIQPVYHHLYEFGTTSVFISFGIKTSEKEFDVNNQIVSKKYVKLKVVADERIADGFFYASAFKLYQSLIKHPERLETPPETVIEDVD